MGDLFVFRQRFHKRQDHQNNAAVAIKRKTPRIASITRDSVRANFQSLHARRSEATDRYHAQRRE
ncbi:hypothetical protein AB0I53_48780 [Saccharopolyspora sp. NPDC050389]|uniref:hypothetical protein n=1 Tax=Saccharopolyspora sp. NPDC050389 TaxID=3155516 RepID=UPI0033D403BA